MAYCAFPAQYVMLEHTTVSNLFISELMPNMSGDHVKVYLAALMQCSFPKTAEPTLARFASSLNMSEEKVKLAFAYFQRKGLAVQQKDGSWEFTDVRTALFDEKGLRSSAALYQHTELANSLAAVKGMGRAFTPKEEELLYDLVDCDGFEPDAVAMLAHHCAQVYKTKLTKAILTSVSREWREKGLKTALQARAHLTARELMTSEANKLLTAIGIIGRPVTQAEHELYKKWTGEWGMSMEEIKAKLDTMTGSRNPNFKYLDRILQSLREEGPKDEELAARVRQCARALGSVGMVTPSQQALYLSWSEKLDHQAILRVCSLPDLGGFDKADSLISALYDQGVRDEEGVRAWQKLKAATEEALKRCALERPATRQDMELMKKWTSLLPLEVVFQAAEYAVGTKRPTAYIGRLVHIWSQTGVKTAEEARREREKLKSAEKPGGVHFENERKYEAGRLDGLLDDMSGWEE